MAAGNDTPTSQNKTLVVLSVGGLIWYAFLWSFGLLGCITARRRFRNRPRSPLATASASAAPGVSILRPLKGLDTNLYENLESTFTQEYPKYEILLSVADESDQALAVVRDLMGKYPNVNAQVVIGEEVVGVNPKVNNLIRSYRKAAHDIVWVLDSGVMAAPGTLARSVDALMGPPPSADGKSHRKIGLVHHVPFAFGSSGGKPGSRLEEAFLNTNHAKMYIALNTIAVESCVVGKSNLYRRSDLDRVNGYLKPIPDAAQGGCQPGERGLAVFGRFLAEDNMIASALWHELGQRHDMSCDVARNAVGHMTFSDYVWRRVRWLRVRKHMVLAATILEPFTESVILGLILACSLKKLLGIPAWMTLPVHFLSIVYVDLDVYASLAGHPLPSSSRWSFLCAWAARELLALPIWILAMFGSEVEWRGKKYQVLRDGEVKRTGGSHSSGWFGWISRKHRDPEHYERLNTVTD